MQGRPWNLASAVSALGMEQVRSMALAMSLIEVSKARKTDVLRAKKTVGIALSACFGARALAKGIGEDKDVWGLRALFMGCLPLFIDLHAPVLGDKLRNACDKVTQWPEQLKWQCLMSEEVLLDKMMQAWKLPSEMIKVQGGSKKIAQSALAAARVLSLEQEEFQSLTLALSNWDSPVKFKAICGLIKGMSTASLCGMDPSGSLVRQAMKQLNEGVQSDQIAAAWLTSSGALSLTEEKDFEAQKGGSECFKGHKEDSLALILSSSRSPITKDLAKTTWKSALNGMAKKTMQGALRSDIALEGLEVLATTLRMDRAMCAFGSSLDKAKVCAVLGSRVWAREFLKQRVTEKRESFDQSVKTGIIWTVVDTSVTNNVQTKEWCFESGYVPRGWIFIPIGPLENVYGFIVLTSSKALSLQTEELAYEELAFFISQWTLSLMLSKT